MIRYTKNEFLSNTKPTIGVEFATKIVNINGKSMRIQIWDTSGSERYSSVTSTYYRGAIAALLVYDITNRSSFEGLEKWLTKLRDVLDSNSSILLVGNKSDLKHYREVRVEEATEYAQNNNMSYIETSALEMSNVEKAFRIIIEGIYIYNIFIT